MSTERANTRPESPARLTVRNDGARNDFQRTPIVFGNPNAQLFGFHYAPDAEVARETALVFCNSFGFEAMCFHRTYRVLAEELSARGFHVLRFDYPGTGDSAGQDDDPGRVGAFLASIAQAIAELKKRASVDRVCLFGLRLGATLALLTAGEREDVEAVVAWNACITGRAFLRELRALQMAKASEGLVFKDSFGGDLEAGGYFLSSQTVNDLSEIDLSKVSPRTLKHALVLSRDDLPTQDARLVKTLRESGVEVSAHIAPGYADMARDAEHTIVPSAALELIAHFLCERFPEQGARAPISGVSSSALEATVRSGSKVCEHAFNFGNNDELFGVLAAPLNPNVRPKAAVIFTNVGANHHVGSNRLYVTISRELAARGVIALRFDISGVGDSQVRTSQPASRIYARESILDVRQAISHLQKHYDISKFVVAGICSGAYLAFHTAAVDARVSAQILINPQTFEWHEGDSLEVRQRRYKSVRFYRYALFHPGTWTRLFNGEVNARGIARHLLQKAASRAQASLARLLGNGEAKTAIESSFYEISERGTHSLLIYSASDAGLDVIAGYLGPGARKMQRRKNFHIEVVDGADHTFTPRWSQGALTHRIVNFVTQTLDGGSR